MNTRTLARWLSLPLLVVAAAALAQTPIDIEVGYRLTNIGGNEDMYRTQINERSGFLIRAFTMQGVSETSLVEHFRIDANDLGTGPAGVLRLDAGKSGKYRVRLCYRRTNFFSALPEFANPLLGQGIVPGQHTYDRNRHMLDDDTLSLVPGAGNGNNSAPVLGRDITASGITRTSHNSGYAVHERLRHRLV